MLTLIMFRWFAFVANFLRDSTSATTAGRRPFSLGRIQLAVWLVVIFGTGLFLSLRTGTYANMMQPTIFALLAISVATAICGSAIDARKGPDARSLRAISGGFWNDILEDGGGLALHRVQVSAWTGLLAVAFLKRAFDTMAMPKLDSPLLGLMALYSGTYLGFKIFERKRSSF